MLVWGNDDYDVGGSTGVDRCNYNETSLRSFNLLCVLRASTHCSKYRLQIRKVNEIRRKYPQTRTRS
jgi:hypothetical protein